jgi:hypothetical protein
MNTRLFPRASAAVLLAALCLALALPGLARANGYAMYDPPLCWSPDGQWLAAAVGGQWPQEEQLPQGELRIYDRYGRYNTLAKGGVASPSFSADGTQLAAVVDGNVRLYTLTPAAASGGWASQPVQLTKRGDLFDCRFSGEPAAEQLYVTAGQRFYGCALYVLPLHQEGLRPFYNLGAEASLFGPALGPGNLLCFLQQPAPDGGAYERLMLRREQQSVQLTRPGMRGGDYHESNAVWLDAGHILFQRGGWGDWNLYRIDIATQNEVIEANDAESPSLSGDMRCLAIARRDPQAKAHTEYDWELPSSIWVRDRESGAERQLSLPGADAAYPALSPDGKRIAWLQAGPAGVRVIARTNPLFR